MKKLRIVLSVILAVVIAAFCFAACSNGTKTNTDSKETLIMATNASFPPYEYKEGDDFAGIDVEIAGLIAEKLDMNLEIKDVEFGSIIAGVQTGKFSMGMAGMTVTDERLKSVNFTTSYAHAKQVVIVKEDSGVTSFEEFYATWDADENPETVVEGTKIGVQQDTTGDIYASDKPIKWGFGEENVVRYKTGNDAVQALVAGKVSAVIIDNEPAKSYVASNEGLVILDGAYADEDYAICVAKNNTELLDKINAALAELTAEGKIQEVIEKYIPAEN